MPKPKLPPTDPHFGHFEAETVMLVLLRSGHELADYLVNKIVEGGADREVYEKLRDRVKERVATEQHDPDSDPEYNGNGLLYSARDLDGQASMTSWTNPTEEQR